MTNGRGDDDYFAQLLRSDDFPVEPASDIAARVAWLRATVPHAQLAKARVFGAVGTEPSLARRIASAAVQRADGMCLDPTTALHAGWQFLLERERCSAETGPQGLMLCGPPGTGKTVAAMYVMACSHMPIPACPPPGRPVEYYVTSSLATSAYEAGRGAMHKYNKDPDTFGAMKSVKILLIDDLGQEDEDIARGVKECLDARKSQRGCMTLVTTNLSLKELSERYGKAVVDRMGSMLVRAEVEGSSYRQQEPGW